MATATDALVDAIADAVFRRLQPLLTHAIKADQKLLSVKDAAKYMGRSPSSIRDMIAAGTIPASVAKRMGRRVFLVKENLDRWLQAQ